MILKVLTHFWNEMYKCKFTLYSKRYTTTITVPTKLRQSLRKKGKVVCTHIADSAVKHTDNCFLLT